MPKALYEDLFPPTVCPLSRLLDLFIDLYEALNLAPGAASSLSYQAWFTRWWEVWCQELFGRRDRLVVEFYNARWWWDTRDIERKHMCDMLEHYINLAREGQLELHLLVRFQLSLRPLDFQAIKC